MIFNGFSSLKMSSENRSAGTLFPDQFIRSALKALQKQMDIHVTKALRMDKERIELKTEKDRNLMESLALKENNAKVRNYRKLSRS
jgi:hypothetical protein